MGTENEFIDHYHVLGLDLSRIKRDESGVPATSKTQGEASVKDAEDWSREKFLKLGIEPASQRQISSAYRRLALKFHPDKLRHQKLSDQEIAQAKERFDAITKSYTVLQNKQQKIAFDAEYLRRKQDILRQQAKTERLKKLEQELLAREREAERERVLSGGSIASRDRTLQHIQQEDRKAKRRLYEKFINTKLDVGAPEKSTRSEGKLSKEFKDFRHLYLKHEEEIIEALRAK